MTTMLRERLKGAMNPPMSAALSGVRCMTTGSAVSGTLAKGAMSIVASIMMMTTATGITTENTVEKQNEFDYKRPCGATKTEEALDL